MISLVAAIDYDRVIGDSESNSIPWYCKTDLELFRRTTLGSTVVVGRKTWDSLPQAVKNDDARKWWVVSHDEKYFNARFDIDWKDRIKSASIINQSHVVIAGGASIYKQALEAGIVDRALLTWLPFSSGGDIEWPGLKSDRWTLGREKWFNWQIKEHPTDQRIGDSRLKGAEMIRIEEWVSK